MKNPGFTLIELSIVLVIIGLVTGGVLVGRDLIDAATVRAQVSQLEKYNSATNTFRSKYGYLPGDIPDPVASQYGFIPRGLLPGMGDGNGIIEGYYSSATPVNTICEDKGESTVFWVDLSGGPSGARLVEGNFITALPTNAGPGDTTAVGLFLPQAKIGKGNYLYVWSDGNDNYFGLSGVTWIGQCVPTTTLALSVNTAYQIDKKIDDGMPQSGRVTARYINVAFGTPPTYGWAAAGYPIGGAYTTATTGSASTCYDNSGGSGAQQYSVGQNSGAGLNCALSFRFQ